MSKKLVIVSNSGPLISLSKVNKFALLKKLYGELYISPHVYNEVVKKGQRRAGQKEVEKAVKDGWIKVEMPKNLLAVQSQETMLSKGEAESIVLAQELKANLALVDERKGRISAELLGIRITGTIGILINAKQKGEKIDLRKLIDELRTKGFRLDNRTYQKILGEVKSST